MGALLRLELFVRDVAVSESFYTEVLGFEVDGQRASKDYRALKFGNTRISLQSRESLKQDHPLSYHEQRPGLGIELVIEVPDVDAYYRSVASRASVEELDLRSWGLRDFRVLDPDNFYLRITEPEKSLG